MDVGVAVSRSRSNSTGSDGWDLCSDLSESTNQEIVTKMATGKLSSVGSVFSSVETTSLATKAAASANSSRSSSPLRAEGDFSQTAKIEDVVIGVIESSSSSRASSPNLKRGGSVKEAAVSANSSRSSSPLRAEGDFFQTAKIEDIAIGAMENPSILRSSSPSLKRGGSVLGFSQARPSSLQPKYVHTHTKAKDSQTAFIERTFPKMAQLQRENPRGLIGQFFKDARLLDEAKATGLGDLDKIQARMEVVQEMAVKHIPNMATAEITNLLTSPLFSSNLSKDAVEYPLKHALLGEYSTRVDGDYLVLQGDLKRSGKILNMVVFKGSTPEPEYLQRLARSLDKGQTQVVCFDSNPAIDALPSIPKMWGIREVRFSNCPNLTNPVVPKTLRDLTTITINGRSITLKNPNK